MTLDTLPGWLAQQAKTRGYHIALRHKRLGVWQQRTWAELQQEALRLVQFLQLKGFGQGDTLFLLSHPRPEAILFSIAAQWLGGTAAPLNPQHEPVSLLILLRELKPVFVFAENQLQVDQILALQLPQQTLVYADERGLSGYDHPALVSYSSLLTSSNVALPNQSNAIDTAFTFYRLSEQKQLELQSLSHAEILSHGRQLIAREALTGSEEAFAARAFAASGHARYLLAPWLLAGFKLNFPENIDTRDNDRRELGPSLVVGTAQTYQRLYDLVQNRLPLPGSLQRALFDWSLATNADSFFIRKAIAYWLVIRPLRDVIGFSRTRVPLLVGESLPQEPARFFSALGIQVRAWPDATDWKKDSRSQRVLRNHSPRNETVSDHHQLNGALGASL